MFKGNFTVINQDSTENGKKKFIYYNIYILIFESTHLLPLPSIDNTW